MPIYAGNVYGATASQAEGGANLLCLPASGTTTVPVEKTDQSGPRVRLRARWRVVS